MKGDLTLAAFLLARLEEDEQVARAAKGVDPHRWRRTTDVGDWRNDAVVISGNPDMDGIKGNQQESIAECGQEDDWGMARAEHIARHDPARVLVEVDAARRIIAEHQPQPPIDEQWSSVRTIWWCERCSDADEGPAEAPCLTLRLLALPHAGHPDYREEWKP